MEKMYSVFVCWTLFLVLFSQVNGFSRRNSSQYYGFPEQRVSQYDSFNTQRRNGSHPQLDVYLSQGQQQEPKKEPIYQYQGRGAWSQNQMKPDQTGQNPKPPISYRGRNNAQNQQQPIHHTIPTGNQFPQHGLGQVNTAMNPGIVPFIDPDLPDGLDDLWEMQQKHSAIQHMMNTNPGLAQAMLHKQTMQGQVQGQPKNSGGPGSVKVWTNPVDPSMGSNLDNQQQVPRGEYEAPAVRREPNTHVNYENGPMQHPGAHNSPSIKITHQNGQPEQQPRAMAFRSSWYRRRGEENRKGDSSPYQTATRQPQNYQLTTQPLYQYGNRQDFYNERQPQHGNQQVQNNHPSETVNEGYPVNQPLYDGGRQAQQREVSHTTFPPMSWDHKRPEMSEYVGPRDLSRQSFQKGPESENEQAQARSWYPDNPGRFQGNHPNMGVPTYGRRDQDREMEIENENEGRKHSFSMSYSGMGDKKITDVLLDELIAERMKQRGIVLPPEQTKDIPYQSLIENGHYQEKGQWPNQPERGMAKSQTDPGWQDSPKKNKNNGEIPSITGREVWVDPKNQKEISASKMKPDVLNDILDRFFQGGMDEIETPYGKIEREANGGFEMEGDLLRMLLQEIRERKKGDTTGRGKEETTLSPRQLEHSRKLAGFDYNTRNTDRQNGNKMDTQSSQEVVDGNQNNKETIDQRQRDIWDSLPTNPSETGVQPDMRQNSTKSDPYANNGSNLTNSNPLDSRETNQRQDVWYAPPNRPDNSDKTRGNPQNLWQAERVPTHGQQPRQVSPWDPIDSSKSEYPKGVPSQRVTILSGMSIPNHTVSTDVGKVTLKPNVTRNNILSQFSVNLNQTPFEDPMTIRRPQMAARIIQLPDDVNGKSENKTKVGLENGPKANTAVQPAEDSAFDVIIVTLVAMGLLLAPAGCIMWRIRKKLREEKRKKLRKIVKDQDSKLTTQAMIIHDFGHFKDQSEISSGARRKTYFKDYSANEKNVHELQPLNSTTGDNPRNVIVHQVNEVY